MLNREATGRGDHPYAGVLNRIEDDEAELAELENQRKQEAEPAEMPEQEPSSLGAEPDSYKKRYDDIRRHQQQKQKEYEAAILELRKQLIDAKTPKNVELPKTEEELSAFIESYPDLASLIETMIEKRVRDVSGDVSEVRATIEQEKAEVARERAAARLLQDHPDLDDIKGDERFHAWVEEQPDNIKWALWKNTTDWKAASRALDLYKRDMAEVLKKTAPRTTQSDAARSVQTRRNAEPRGTGTRKATWSESKLARMKSSELTEEVMDEIVEARRNGTFEYDMSGAAR